MAFHNIPPNGFPDIPDMEELEAVAKDVTTLKTSVVGLASDVSNLSSSKANQITIAPFFNAETAYEVGDLVYYNGLSYRCTNDREGEWDADDFAATTIANELDTLKSGLMNKATVNRGSFNGSGTASGKTYIDISSYGTKFPAMIFCTTHRSYALYAIYKENNNLYLQNMASGGTSAPVLSASDDHTILISNDAGEGGQYIFIV